MDQLEHFLRRPYRQSSGQALLEFLGSVCLLLPLGYAVAHLFFLEWKRFQCLVWTFEVSHAVLHQEWRGPSPEDTGKSLRQGVRIDWRKTEVGQEAVGHTSGGISEKLFLPILEKAVWH